MKKITVMGGGTGTYTLLKGLKNYSIFPMAIVSMADSGGSSGQLRDEFGILPPGDLRRCLIALSEGETIWRELFEYKFNGEKEKNNLGNLIMTALTEIKGDIIKAIDEVSNILNITGKVIPVTIDNSQLCAKLENGEIIEGETNIDIPKHNADLKIISLYLKPESFAYKKAIEAIESSDIIVIGPGDLYSSLIPNFLVKDISEALQKTKAKIIYVPNIMTKYGETNNFKTKDFVEEIKKYLGKYPEVILCNNQRPSKDVELQYEKQNSFFVENNLEKDSQYQIIEGELLDESLLSEKNNKILPLIRHDSMKLARAVMEIK